MEKIHSVTTQDAASEQTPRPWASALLSGALFGSLGAAAMHWLGYHSVSPIDRSSTSFGRRWTSALAGIASGTVAAYGTLRAEDAQPRSVFPELEEKTPKTVVSAESAVRDSVIPSPGVRSL